MEVTITDYRHYPLSQIFPLTSASSLESIQSTANLSRRPSVMNPPSAANLTGSKSQEKKDVNNEIVESAIAENNPDDEDVAEVESALGKKEELTLDPLGVIEELQRSRRNSPDPNEGNTTASSGPSISKVVSSTESATPNTLSVLSHHQQQQPLPPKIEGVSGDPILVPYLSPLVLRKELENVLDHEGDTSLVQPKFVDEHPIIYWNLVWFFHRANLTSHIKGLCLNAKTVLPSKKISRKKEEGSNAKDDNKPDNSLAGSGESDDTELVDFSIHPSWTTADHRNVSVKCKWDNSKFHNEYGNPLYTLWLKNKEKENKAEKEDTKGEDSEEPLVVDNNIIK